MELLKNLKKNTIILISMTILILFIVLRKDMVTVVKELKTMDLKYIGVDLLLYFLYLALHSYVVYITVNKKEKFTFLESLKHNIIVQFFNGITPFSTGGQPMEIYMLREHDISGSKATNYIIENFIFYQLALVLFGIVAVLLNLKLKLFQEVNILREFVILGFIVNTLVAIFLLVISLSKKVTKKLINTSINILFKMHIVKDKEEKRKIWESRVEEFHECANELKKRKSLFFIGIFLNFIGLACLYTIPLLIVYALHDFHSLNIINAIIASAYVMVMGSFVPIPGASGGIEYGFTQFFGNFLNKTRTKTTLLVWRFITYYIGMIIGACLFNMDKSKKEK